MKKFLLTILISLLSIASCMFFACGEPNYYEVIYTKVDGVTYVSDAFPYKVKEGKPIQFKLKLDNNCTGTPIVYANDQVVTPNEDGVYTININAETIIDVGGVELIEMYDITFDTAGGYVRYEIDGENVDEGLTAQKGDVLEVDVNVSVYYKQEFKVAANTEFLTANQNGKYSFTVSGDVNVSVIGLEQEDCFFFRSNGGRGTATDPYRIEKPIDLFYMAQVINDDYYAGSAYYEKYYKLMNDIDLNGEQMFVIGDNTTSTAFFAGSFDGNGHTIRNFYLSDTLMGQDTFLPYLGMFGFCSATTARSPQIFNLTLEDFSLHIDAGKYETTFFAGGLVGFGIGVDIWACHVEGSVSADADYGYFGYIGGLIGGFQSAYSSDDVRYYSSIRSCSANVDVSAHSGYVYGAGGITGIVMSYEERTNAFILNCYTEGFVSGALRSGGIVGSVEGNTSVIGSYSTADISAKSTIPTTGDQTVDVYSYAYGGGIAGYADYNSIISECFFDGSVSASSNSGAEYQKSGQIVGEVNANGSPTVDAVSSVLLNNYSAKDQAITNEFLKETLNYADADWVFHDDGYPTVNLGETHKTFTVTVNYGENLVNGNSTDSFDITDIYIPVSYWNLVYDGDEIALPEYIVADSGLRSYGYYFENGDKVPYAYVPTHDITIVAKFADYSEVVGKYYIQAGNPSNDIYLTLNNDGTFDFINGAMSLKSTYYYDGEEVVLQYTALAILGNYTDSTLIENANGFYFTFKATVENGVMSIWDNDFFPTTSKLTAIKSFDKFVYGEYYNTSGKTYNFYGNGQGVITESGTANKSFYYYIDSEKVVINGNNLAIEGSIDSNGMLTTVDEETVTLADKFKGTWEKSATSYEEYTFDGKGGWTSVKFKYLDKDGEIVKEEYDLSQGTYTVNIDVVTLNNGTQFTLTQDGFLSTGNEIFYKDNSFVGTWRFSNKKEPIELVLNGIDLDGVGSATVTYGTNKPYALTYQQSINGITLFYNDLEVANLTFNKLEKTLNGDFISLTNYQLVSNSKFCIYDDYKGEWISSKEGFETVIFNGLGNYDLRGTSSYLAVKSSITINGVKVGGYSLTNGTLNGSFVYNGITYLTTYNNALDVILVTDGENSFSLQKYDYLKGVTLTDNNGYTISFDGRGVVGGKIICSDTNEYSYTFDLNSSSIIMDIGTITVGNNGSFMLTIGTDTKELFVVNPFAGKWVVSNQVNKYLEIGNMLANFTANGSYLGESVVFTYDRENDCLTFDYKSQTMYIFALTNELLIGTSSYKEDNNAICIKDGKQDDFYGVYTSVSGLNKVYFDGLGESVYSNGIAIVRNNEGNITAQFVYRINEGVMMLTDSYGLIYYLVETDQTNDNAYLINSVYYEIKAVDILYKEVAYDGNNVKFTFDGIGGVVCSNGDIYTYSDVVDDNVNFKVTMTLVSSDSVTYTAVLDYSVYPYQITLTQVND